MVSSSKILTVSYGTFSCTAEGYEDPLAVVKETTQFFRGVVGEDRFFGAEPPQFDPELAAEIMREQLPKELGDGKLSLGQTALGAAAGAASTGASAAALSDSAAPVADLLPDDDTIEATAILSERLDEPALNDEDTLSAVEPDLDAAQIDVPRTSGSEAAPALQSPTSEEDITARLDRIRAVVSEDLPAEPSGDLADDLTDDATETVDNALDGIADIAAAEAPAADDLNLDALLSTIAAEDTLGDLKDIAAPVQDLATGTTLDETIDAAQDAVSKAVQNSVDAPEDSAEDSGSGLAGTLAGVAAAGAAALGAAALGKGDDDQPDTALTPEVDLANLEGEDLETALKSSSDADLEAALKDLSAWDDDASDDAENASDAAMAESAPQPAPEDPQPEPAIETPQDIAPAPATSAIKAPVRARVVKVKRVDFEKAVQSGAFEEVQDDPEPTAAPQPQSTLTAEDEDELSRELAAVQAELNGTPPPAPAEELSLEGFEVESPTAAAEPLRLDNPIDASDLEDLVADEVRSSARKAVKMASPARAMLTEKSVEDQDASRLMEQADTEMDEPEGSRRRTALAHLRAAVAATKAERSMGPRTAPSDDTEPYREDLANVVRPRRPQAGSARTERPRAREAQPTPLKLVPENRVTDGSAQPVTPVRPRRVARVVPDAAPRASVAAPQTANANSGDGFSAFASKMGATELPELLEAAAAYISFVEGMEQFSRPQLMRTVSEVDSTEYTREDRLRNFGQLLREGKIEKTEGGRFIASSRNSYHPDRVAS